MFMTEADADNKWCPIVRLPAQFSAKAGNVGIVAMAAAAVNVEASRIAGQDLTRHGNNTTCIGSKCAMWRWGDAHELTVPADAGQRRLGYCGLAGTPLITTEERVLP